MTKKEAAGLRAGDYVYLSGTIYTARDAAHKRMDEALDRGEELPFDINGNVIYYMGPSPAREGRPIGSAGPTTASRMDKYTPRLLDLGLGAMLSKCILKSEVVAYEDLGTEAIRRLTVKDFPVIVVADTTGNNLYESAVREYREIV